MPSRSTLVSLSLTLCTALAAAATVAAQTIVNPSFESPALNPSEGVFGSVPGYFSTNQAGIIRNGDFADFIAGGEGTQLAYLGVTNGVLFQDTGLIQADTTYTFSAGAAFASDQPGGAGTFTLRLVAFADGADVGSPADAILIPSAVGLNIFNYQSVSLTAAQIAAENLVGRQLRVVIFGNGDSTQFARIDNLTLTATVIPEPSSAALLLGASGLGAAFLRRRRRA